MAIDFTGPRLKLKRAKHHIRELETSFGRYVRANLNRSPQKGGNRKGKGRAQTFGGRLPPDTPTILGDAIHNLRVTLDHAYNILVADTGVIPDDYATFPFGKDVASIRGSIKGWNAERKASAAVMDKIVDDLQPYPGGKYSLYDLHRLDIGDKHVTLVAITHVTHVDDLRIYNQSGQVVGGISGISFVQEHSPKRHSAIVSYPAGHRLELGGDPQSAFDILFGKGPLEGESILTTLQKLSGSVEAALVELESVA